MRALLQLSKRISRALIFSSSSYSSLTSSRTFATLTLFSPDCNGAAITTNGNVYARPWFAIQHRGVKVNAIHLRPGNVIEKSGRIFEVVDAEHKQRGRGGAILTMELRDVDSGNKQTLRFGAEEAVESMFINFKFSTPMLDDAFLYILKYKALTSTLLHGQMDGKKKIFLPKLLVVGWCSISGIVCFSYSKGCKFRN